MSELGRPRGRSRNITVMGFALFNSRRQPSSASLPRRFNPEIAPFRFAGAFIGFFAGARDGAILYFAVLCAERKLDMAAMLAGMTHNARSCGWRGAFGGEEIRKFLVFITQRAAFQLPVLRRAFHSLGEMAPVSCGSHGTHEMMRTRSKDGSRIGKHHRPRRVDGGKTTAGSRLNENKKFACALPGLVEHGFGSGLRQLAQRI
jgi:hypothetical protein